ncbi:hypothetical protein U1Q18_032468 [Sarracenia purpurea var. burkii]
MSIFKRSSLVFDPQFRSSSFPSTFSGSLPPELQAARQHPANSGQRPGRETDDGRITVEEKKSSEEPGVFPERRCVRRRCTVDWVPLVRRSKEDGNSTNQGARNLGQ